jgi:hypothetical protein
MKIQPRYSRDEFARRGDEVYERNLRSLLDRENEGKFVTIDIETGTYEVDANELAVSVACSHVFPTLRFGSGGSVLTTRIASGFIPNRRAYDRR